MSGVDPQFWLKMGNTPAGRAWAGYAFESLCMKHIRAIKGSLGIGAVSTKESSWTYRPAKSSHERGVQIDLLIDRADNCINLCEIKCTNDEFVMEKDYAATLRYKKVAFIQKTKTKKSVFLTFISTYGIKKSKEEASAVDLELTMDALFH